MGEFFSHGGFGMYPVLLFGFQAIAAAMMFLLRSEPRFVPLVVALGFTTATAAMLGFATGLMGIFRFVQEVPAEERILLVAQGVSESLHPVVLALIFLVVTAVLCSAATFRASRTAASSRAAA